MNKQNRHLRESYVHFDWDVTLQGKQNVFVGYLNFGEF